MRLNANAAKLVDNYYSWLRERTQLKDLDRAVEITTPFLDRHNDYIQIYLINSEIEISLMNLVSIPSLLFPSLSLIMLTRKLYPKLLMSFINSPYTNLMIMSIVLRI